MCGLVHGWVVGLLENSKLRLKLCQINFYGWMVGWMGGWVGGAAGEMQNKAKLGLNWV